MDAIVILLEQYTPLLHKTLRKASIFQAHRQYDDYLQELRLKLLDVANRFDGDPLSVQDCFRFTAYAGRALYWYLINLIEADKSYREQPSECLIYNEEGQIVQPNLDQHLALQAFCSQAKEVLNAQEWQVFTALVQEAHSVKDLAQDHGCSVQAIYQCKHRIARKLRQLKEKFL